MLVNNRVYDVSKFFAQILLPAVGTLYFALAQIWGLPNAEKVVGTIVAVDAFLGVILGLASKQYNNSDARYDGAIVVEQHADGPKTFNLELHTDDPYTLDQKKEVIFKVTPQ